MTAPDPRVGEIEAIEAAARAIYQNQTGMDWESRSDVLKETVRGDSRAALEAAHPVLLAELRKAHEALARVEALADKWWANFPSKARAVLAAVAAAKGSQ